MATTTNSMIFNNLSSKTTKVESNLLDLTLLDTYDISGIILINNFLSKTEITTLALPFQPINNLNTEFIKTISFDCIPADSSKQALTLYLDEVKTIYTLNKFHFVKDYPYLSSSSSSTQPTAYGLVVEFNSYNNPVKDKLFIYIPISQNIDSSKENKLLKYLHNNLKQYETSSSNNTSSTNNLSLTNIIPSNKIYYCHNFTDHNNVNVKNIFFDSNYSLFYSGEETIITNHLSSSSSFRNTIEQPVPYLYKSSKYINYVSELFTSNTQDIYIDCSPADMNLSEKENIPYLQKLTSSIQYGGNDLTIGLSYLVFMLVISLIVYFIFKIPSLFKSSQEKSLEDSAKLIANTAKNINKIIQPSTVPVSVP